MFSRQFLLDMAERALKTFAQALVATLAVGVPIFDVDWLQGIGIAATATIISILTSIASGSVGEKDSASLVSSASSVGGRHEL